MSFLSLNILFLHLLFILSTSGIRGFRWEKWFRGPEWSMDAERLGLREKNGFKGFGEGGYQLF